MKEHIKSTRKHLRIEDHMPRSVISDDKIREIFIANGFTIKEGDV